MYGEYKNIPEHIRVRIKSLLGISYADWVKIQAIIVQSFEKKKGEAIKDLHLSDEKDIFNPF